VGNVRRAGQDDIDFVVTAIIEAERGGSGATVYERVFDLSPTEVRALVREMVEQGLDGSELSCASFWLALDRDAPMAGLAAWIEGSDGPGSAMLRAAAISRALGRKRWQAAAPRLRALRAVDVARQPGTLQIESVYTAPEQRGRGVVRELIERAIADCRATHAHVTRCQILSVVENGASARAFARAGFRERRRVTSSSPEVLALFPGSGRILWGRDW
jgi:predicted GNAT family acetyltransferase